MYAVNICLPLSTYHDKASMIKRPGGRVVSAPDFGSRGPELKSRENSSHGCTAFQCTETFIIILPLSRYDLNNVEMYVKHQTIIIILP